MRKKINDAPEFIGVGDFVYRDDTAPVIVNANGVCLTDRRGYRYLDATAANGAAALGYDASIAREAVRRVEALPAQPSFCESELRLELAQRLERKIGPPLGRRGRVAFALGGAQGIELALKIARNSQPDGGFVVFEGGYHGRSLGTAHLSANRRYGAGFENGVSSNIIRLPSPDCEKCRFQQQPDTCAVECLGFAQRALEDELCGNRLSDKPAVSAMIFESVQNVAGMARPDKRYLSGTIETVKRNGGIVIADEIFTGLHRFGPAWGFELDKLEPDIVVVSKALTNGMSPLSAVWAADPLLAPEHFPPGSDSATFGNVPWSMAIANTVMDRFDTLDVPARVAQLEQRLHGIAQRLAAGSNRLVSVQVLGSVVRLHLSEPSAAELRNVARHIAHDDPVAGYHGLFLATTGMAPDVVVLNPPYVIGDEDLSALETLTLRALGSDRW